MSKSIPPLTWFRAFDAAARHLNFTVAATELNLTQSAVSQHVRALETRLGVALFVRKPRGLALTDAGRALVPDVAAAMARLQAATDLFAPTLGQDTLTIAASVSFAQWYLAPGLADFRSRCPDLAVRLITTVWPDDFTAASADIEIRFGTAEVVGRGAKPLGGGHMAVVGSAAMLGDIGHSDWPRLLRLPLIQPVGIAVSWARLARSLGVGPCPDPACFVDSHGLAVDLAVQGAGLALSSALIAAPSLRRGALIALPIPETRTPEGYFIAQRDAGPETPAGRFAAWLRDRVGGYDDLAGQAAAVISAATSRCAST